MTNPRTSIAPAFILSGERSGSTLLRYIVDTHPEIASPGQLYLGQLCQDLHTVVNRTLGEVAGITDAVEREQMVLSEVRQVVGGTMDRYAAAKNKRMWCEKTTANLDHLGILDAVFPDAKYVCLYRNAMDVVHSCIEVGRLGFMTEHLRYVQSSPDNIVAAMVQRWIDNIRTLLRFEREHGDRCTRITYESYVLHPAEALAPMFAFLGAGWSPELLDQVFSTRHDPGDGDNKVRYASRISQDSIGKGSTINRRLIPERLLEEMNALLHELGYPIVGPDWDSAPSPYRAMAPVAPAAGPAHAGIQEIFSTHLPARLGAAAGELQERRTRYKVVVTGAGGGVWTIDPARPRDLISAGDGPADCTLTMSAGDLIDMMKGKLNAAEAWMQGRLHIAGDPTQAEFFGRMLFQR